MKSLLPKLMFGFAIVGISFGYGFISSKFEIFPYELIRQGFLAYDALVELASEQMELKNIDFWDESGRSGPEYRSLVATSGNEMVFVLGNERTYPGQVGEESYLAWIADREGKIVHAWRNPGEIWAPIEGREAVGDRWRSYPVGAELLPNGDILVSYHGVGVFPSAMGLARFDKDSNLLWKRNDYYHHWFSVGPDGNIYVPDLEFAESPVQIADQDKRLICDKVRFPYDSIAVLDSQGNKLREIDTLDALVNSDLAGLFNSNKENPHVIETCDPMHLNDAQLLSESMAQHYPDFSAGDLLVSFRTLNAVGVIDLSTERFKWHFVGPSHHQHSPRFLGDGRVALFDNFGGRVSRGQSRIVAVDTQSNEASTIFPNSERDVPETPFSSDTAGHVDVSGDGERILVSWTHQGLVWEIDVATGEVLWEFVNTQPVDDKFARVSVYTAKYVRDLAFEVNDGRTPALD